MPIKGEGLMKRKRLWLFGVFTLVIIFSSACQMPEQSDEVKLDEVAYANTDYPTETPLQYAAQGILSDGKWNWHSGPAFVMSGKEMYWSKFLSATQHLEIWKIEKTDQGWTTGSRVEIEGIEGELNCPTFTNNEDLLYFYALEGAKGTIYQAKRNGNHWNEVEPVLIDVPEGKMISWGFSIAKSGNLYFTLATLDGSEMQKLYYSEYVEGQYSEPIELISLNEDGSNAMNPEISSDENLLIFESDRKGGHGGNDLYFSKRDETGKWTSPTNLGSKINTVNEEFGATISPDGKYLFFESQRKSDLGYNAYWVIMPPEL